MDGFANHDIAVPEEDRSQRCEQPDQELGARQLLFLAALC